MKELKIITNQGRMPLWITDLGFLQSSAKEVLIALISELGLGKSNFIITGCTITLENSYISMTAGWAYYQGDILPVQALPSTAYSANSPLIYFTRTTRYNAGGRKNFVTASNTTTTLDTYSDDYLSPAVVTGNVTFYLGIKAGFWTLGERLRRRMALDSTEWIVASSVYNIHYKKIGSVVYLKGYAFQDAVGTGFTDVTIAELPVPDAGTIYFPGTSSEISELKITSAGNLIVTSTADTVRVDHISYLISQNYTESSDYTYNTVNGGGATPSES